MGHQHHLGDTSRAALQEGKHHAALLGKVEDHMLPQVQSCVCIDGREHVVEEVSVGIAVHCPREAHSSPLTPCSALLLEFTVG